MSLFVYPNSWNEEKTKLAEDIVESFRNSQLSLQEAIRVLGELSDQFEDIDDRSSGLFSIDEIMSRDEAKKTKRDPALACVLGRSVQKHS